MRSRFSPVIAGTAVGLLVEVAELLLEQAVDGAGLLLLPQLQQVLGLADATAAVLARRVRPLLEPAAAGVEDVGAQPAADAVLRSGVASHCLRPSDASWGGSRCAAPA